MDRFLGVVIFGSAVFIVVLSYLIADALVETDWHQEAYDLGGVIRSFQEGMEQ